MNAPQPHPANGSSPAAVPATTPAQPQESRTPFAELLDRNSERYKLALEPRNQDEGWDIAEAAARAGLAPSADEAYARILIGRPLGIPAMASIQSIALVENKSTGLKTPCMYAKLKLALLQARKDIVEYIRPKELTNTEAVWEAKRVGDPEPVKYKFSIDDARIAGLVGRGDGRTNSAGVSLNNYDRHPGPMLQWRACGRLCDIVGADILTGVATREDIEDELRIARQELEEQAAAAGRGETPRIDAPAQAKPATVRDFRAEAEGLKAKLTDAVSTKNKAAMQDFHKAYKAFKADAPAELSEEIQKFYSAEVGKARKPGTAAAAAPPPPVPASAPAAEPAASHASPYLPPEQRGDSYDGPEDPLS